MLFSVRMLCGVALATFLTNPLMAAGALPLHDRIVAREEFIGEPKVADELKAVRALIAELDAQAHPDPDDRARLQLLLVVALTHADDNDGALKVLVDGIAQIKTAGRGDSSRAAEMMMNQATLVGDLGQRDEADRLLHAVLAIQTKQSGPDSVEVGTTLCLIAYNANLQGRLGYAIDQIRRGLERMKPDDKNRMAWLSYHTILFDTLSQAGRVEDALIAGRELQALTEKYLQPGHIGASVTLANLAGALNDAGRFGEGEQIARRALDQEVRYRGKSTSGVASDMRTLAKSLAGQGRMLEAESLVLSSEEIFAKLGAAVRPKITATLLVDAAGLARARGDNQAADQRVDAALSILAKPGKGDELIVARALTQQALGALIAGHASEGLPLTKSALANQTELPPAHPLHIDTVMLRGLLLVRAGRAAEAFASTQATAKAMEAVLLANTTPRRELVNLSPSYAHSFERFAAIALAARHEDEAFRAAQLANLSSLAVTNSAVAARAAAGDSATGTLVRSVQDMIGRRAGLDRERSFALGKSKVEVARLDSVIATVDAELAHARADLNTRFPGYQALSRPMPISLQNAMAGLTTDEALLIPLSIDDGLISIIVTKRGLEWQQTDLTSATIASLVGDLRAAVEPGIANDTSFPAAQAYRLYAALVPAKLRAAVSGHRDLVLFGGGPIATLPLGMLLTSTPKSPLLKPAAFRDAPWLIRSHSIAVVATLDHPTAASETANQAESFAGIGAPTLGPVAQAQTSGGHLLRGGIADVNVLRNLPSLPGAADELRAIGTALHPQKSLLLIGNDASETRVRTADLTQYRVIAFATHGLVGGISTIGEPALVLTPPDIPTPMDDGILTASEASTLRLNADWVILSACDSAGATNAATPTYSGLARAFFQAGSKSLLVSMWPVRDDIAARLTVATVNAGQHMSKARALQQSEFALLRDRSIPGAASPANWAPFTLLER